MTNDTTSSTAIDLRPMVDSHDRALLNVAAALGIGVRTLHRKLNRYGLR
ncbi:MAG: hypothetical protein WBO34_06900 [Gammaproteobacteria bacterium]